MAQIIQYVLGRYISILIKTKTKAKKATLFGKDYKENNNQNIQECSN